MEVKMQNRNYNAKSIVEAGLTIALIVAIMLVCTYIPIFFMLTNFILPIPIAVLYIRQNYKVAIISVLISIVLMTIFYNPVSAVTLGILIGVVGITFGYCVKDKKDFSTSMLLLTVAVFISTIAYFSIYINIMTNNGIYGFVSDTIVKPLKDSMAMNKSLYEKMGVDSSQLNSMESTIALFTPEYIMRLIPGMLFIGSIFSAYLTYLIGNSILKKLRYDIVPIRPFKKIYIGPKIGAIVGILLVIGLILNRKNIELANYFINSSALIFQFIFVIDGLALASFYLNRKTHISNKVITIILIFTLLIRFYFIYIFLGLVDAIVDFRKLDPTRTYKK
jgi:uncharacterized protein YybS (DUF2232 family)